MPLAQAQPAKRPPRVRKTSKRVASESGRGQGMTNKKLMRFTKVQLIKMLRTAWGSTLSQVK